MQPLYYYNAVVLDKYFIRLGLSAAGSEIINGNGYAAARDYIAYAFFYCADIKRAHTFHIKLAVFKTRISGVVMAAVKIVKRNNVAVTAGFDKRVFKNIGGGRFAGTAGSRKENHLYFSVGIYLIHRFPYAGIIGIFSRRDEAGGIRKCGINEFDIYFTHSSVLRSPVPNRSDPEI